MMGLGYHFVSLNQAQTERRRQLLDNYGQFAQISALVIPLLAFQASFAVRFLVRKLRSSGKVKEHQSPRVSDFPKPVAVSSSSYWSRLRWTLDEQIVQGWGTRLEWVIGAVWTTWLLLLVVKDTGDGASISKFDFVLPIPFQVYGFSIFSFPQKSTFFLFYIFSPQFNVLEWQK